MEDNVFITRFCFNPARAGSTEVAHETWIAMGWSFQRGAVTRVKQAIAVARWEPAVPRAFDVAPSRRAPSRRASELCPFHAMGARTATH